MHASFYINYGWRRVLTTPTIIATHRLVSNTVTADRQKYWCAITDDDGPREVSGEQPNQRYTRFAWLLECIIINTIIIGP